MSPELVALHLGPLHPYEKVLTLVLAFGPFVVLGLLVVVRRRQDLAEERAEQQAAQEAAQQGGSEPLSGPATRGRPGSPS